MKVFFGIFPSQFNRNEFFSRKPTESQKRDVPLYKKPNLNHTDYAYREAVNRLKVREVYSE